MQQQGGWGKLFLSTPSARRATFWVPFHLFHLFYFYPRPPRGGRPIIYQRHQRYILFLSTPSARRATSQALSWRNLEHISIHALREEGDWDDEKLAQELDDFYPRPPRGGRPRVDWDLCVPKINFYPRPPRGGRPAKGQLLEKQITNFYPRPPRGGRPLHSISLSVPSYFYPRPPRGGRHSPSYNDFGHNPFLSTPSARRATP